MTLHETTETPENIARHLFCNLPLATKIWDALQVSETPESVLETVDKLLGTHGVEYIDSEDDALNLLNGQYGFSYCNTGESYEPTVGYDHDEECFKISSWADEAEHLLFTEY